jgi:hypothetical protein
LLFNRVVRNMVFVAGALLTVASMPVFGQETEGPRSIGGLTFIDEFELTVVNVVVHVTDKSGKVRNGSDQRRFQGLPGR